MLRYGIIGSGMMGQEHMRNIALLEDAQVTAFSDPDPHMTAASVNLSGAAGFTDHRKLLESDLVDAVVIAAPNHTHLPILRDVLKTELPVLCEKPLGITSAECREIVALQEARTAQLWVAMEYRYMPPIARLIEEVNTGTAGQLHMLSIREHRFPFLEKVGDWNRFNAQTGGTLVEKCCHFFDLMRLILKSDPVRVFASGGIAVNHLEEDYEGQTPDILDHAYVVIDFANGTRAMLDLCMFAEGSEWQEMIAATGDKARIDALVPGPARFAPDGEERLSRIEISDRITKRPFYEELEVDGRILMAGDHHGSTFYQHQRFQRMVLSGGLPEVSARDGLIAVAVGEAAEQSVRTGAAVALPVFD